ncbi:DUF2586 family protein [Williamwhitmania taraxaci]|uniref:Mu-like prophage tail sheath protein gpL n=1 Tax=Williamwhitmania taraxaci TaxID=1640674 RepID=A0A1G6MBR2_9BACT|nr:DUF2586 family protein [Williamwhitmania taraxaci]SDC52714.1 hypothetical protein SAMN05216323_103523 [Williamwhitmania taraxaci]
MSIRGFELSKGTVGVSASDLEDNICGLLVNGPEVVASEGISGVVNGTVYPLTKVKDAEGLGITQAYDTANAVQVYRHISEFYRMAGEGTKLYLLVAPAAKTMKETIEAYGQALIIASKGSIFYIGVAHNPAAAYVPTYVDGLESVVREALAPAQALHDWSWNTDRPVNVFLEGRGLNAVGAAALDLRSITNGAAALIGTHISVCIGQDYGYAATLTGAGQKFADVGTLLGTKALVGVNRSVGEVESLDISSATKNRWLSAGLSNHKTIEEMDADLSDFDAKGYIFAIAYTGISGYRWSGDPVCAPILVDDDGYISVATIGQGASLNKAARLLRKKLLPKVKSTVPIDSSTGLLPTGIIKYFEGLGNEAFNNMANAGEISDGKTIVDPNSQLLSGDKALLVSFELVPTASIEKIKGTINLKTTL